MPGRPKKDPDQPKQPVPLPTGVELNRILTEQQYAEMDGVSVDTVRRRCARGEGAPRIRLSPRRVGYQLRDILAARQQTKESS
jgi:predicted DNA-binding transcriptional regulator AlpA